MEACTHAFADPHEATTYAMLGCVLQHHRTTHAVSLLAGLTAPVLLCAGTGMQRCAAGGVEEGPLMPQTLAGLTQQGRTRQARAPLSPLAEADDTDPDDPHVRNQTAALSRALATLLSDAEVAHSISGEESWRTVRPCGRAAGPVAASGPSPRHGRGRGDGPAGPRRRGAAPRVRGQTALAPAPALWHKRM